MIGQRCLAIAAALLSLGAAPATQVIPLPHADGEALVVPGESLVRFSGFQKEGEDYVGARFDGRFKLTGKFTWGCQWDCDGSSPITEKDNFQLRVIPDPEIAARLPHWKIHDNDIAVIVTNPARFARSVTTSAQRKALDSGELPQIEGRISIIVDHFATSLDCDSAGYSAHFVSVAGPTRLGKVDISGNFGCG